MEGGGERRWENVGEGNWGRQKRWREAVRKWGGGAKKKKGRQSTEDKKGKGKRFFVGSVDRGKRLVESKGRGIPRDGRGKEKEREVGLVGFTQGGRKKIGGTRRRAHLI